MTKDKYITIKLITKNNKVQTRKVKKAILKQYVKTKEGYYRKKIPVITKYPQKDKKMRFKKIKIDEAKLIKGEIKQIKISKAKVETKKVKEFKKRNCGFNYQSFYKDLANEKQGYVKEQTVNYILYEGMSSNEIKKFISDSLHFVRSKYDSLKCPQKISYFRFYYFVNMSNNPDDMKNTSWSTKQSLSKKQLLNRSKELAIKLVNWATGYTEIIVYRFELTNYGFKNLR